ncbi:WD40/YVTN/BNR-like repeat-containing protein, partial [Anaerosporobacter sp.]
TLQIGDSKPKEIYFGSNKIKEAWLGSTKLWTSSVPTLVAVGDTGGIMYSTDYATTWTLATTGVTFTLSVVTASPDLFMAGGRGYYLLCSGDGITWTSVSVPFTDVNGIAYGNGKWVVTNGKYSIYYSTDNGLNWTEVTTSSSYWSVKFVNDRFMAFLSNGNTPAYSLDGITWTNTSGSSTVNAYHVAYGDGMYIIGGAAYAQTLSYSYNGANFTESYYLTGDLSSIDMTYGGGYFLLAGVDSSGYYRIYKYQKGGAWSSAGFSSSSTQIRALEYVANSAKYYAVGSDKLIYSSDLSTWTIVSNAFTQYTLDIVFKE